jgi:aminopeptidase N
MVAVPDFLIGAMENWGLVLYRESGILYDYELSSATDQQWLVELIVHELAHQVSVES